MSTVVSKPSSLTTNPLLVGYLSALAANPLRTKMITSGVLSALGEVLAGHFAGVAPTSTPTPSTLEEKKRAAQSNPIGLFQTYAAKVGINERAFKMFLYGFFVSAPMGHVLTGLLQKAFVGRTTTRDKILQIITSNLTVSVFANCVYLACMAYINGARGIENIKKAVKATFWPVMRVTWTTSPITIAVAQNYLPAVVWEPFFTFIRFLLATYFNTVAKKKQMKLARQAKQTQLDSDLAKGSAQGK
ncbi:related to membrane protein, peroxisomal [Melanopsichium pennsylvanicum]|uniref:Related to membrane protein, peroxisomal n=2 Tax=Melanopsichium pennsylvanicum TaxID=63383 RepID=A0AAJ4XG06_9BASI|nr:related to membrane protein, peroxisomal [Melanopsichium pennsylvanicum 4]SNX81417.1 related to membrane protein, peroxisomal [Melanopsichium pennsylvanicum]